MHDIKDARDHFNAQLTELLITKLKLTPNNEYGEAPPQAPERQPTRQQEAAATMFGSTHCGDVTGDGAEDTGRASEYNMLPQPLIFTPA